MFWAILPRFDSPEREVAAGLCSWVPSVLEEVAVAHQVHRRLAENVGDFALFLSSF